MWEVVDRDNSKFFNQGSIKRISRSYFDELYREPYCYNIDDQLGIVKPFPSYFSAEDG